MSKYIYPISFGVTDDMNEDTNDCALRAYCNVTGVSFKTAQIRFAKQGRKYCKGTQVKTLHAVYTNAGMKATAMGSTVLSEYVKKYFIVSSTNNARTIKSMLSDPKYNKGKHIFVTRTHAISVINGKIIDNRVTKGSTRICLVYSMPE